MTQPDDNFDAKAAVKEVSDKIEQPQKFAEVFCAAADTQKSIDECVKKMLRSLIENDPALRESFRKLIRDVDKEDWRYLVKKIGAAGWSIIMLILGAALKFIFDKF